MSIQVQNVSKLYDKQKALDAVSFDVQPGQVLGFLGPNGAGKSTMMKIITCYIPQNEGLVKVCGYDVSEQSIEVRKNVGYLPENNPLYLDMYVREYLTFIAGAQGMKNNIDKRANEMIDITGLAIEQNKKIGALSKGYRQRVGLAQALIHDPKVLILDEPTSGLDPNQLSEIRALIKEIGKEKTVVLSTHIMQEVEAICSRVIIINKGKIVADEATDILHSKYAGHQTVISIEFDKEVSKEKISQIPGIQQVEHLKGNEWRIYAEQDNDIRAALFAFAVQNGLAVLTLHKEEQSLEHIFQNLTR